MLKEPLKPPSNQVLSSVSSPSYQMPASAFAPTSQSGVSSTYHPEEAADSDPE